MRLMVIFVKDVISLMEFILNLYTSYMFAGLTISNGDRWRQLRRFTLTTLRDFGMGRKGMEEWIQEESRHLLKSFEETICERRENLTFPPHESITSAMIHILHSQLSELCDEMFSPSATPVDPAFFLSRAVSNVICSLVFGQRFDYEDKNFLHLLQIISRLLRFFSSPQGQVSRWDSLVQVIEQNRGKETGC